MATVEVQKVKSSSRVSNRDLYAMACYFYPQYTLRDIAQLPARDIHLLIKVAQRMEASKMLNLTQIVAAPHSKNGKSVKKLIEHFKKASKN